MKFRNPTPAGEAALDVITVFDDDDEAGAGGVALRRHRCASSCDADSSSHKQLSRRIASKSVLNQASKLRIHVLH